MARRRKLSAEETELWHRVAARADRMHPLPRKDPADAAAHAPLLQKPKPTAPEPAVDHRLTSFRLGQKADPAPPRHDLKPGLPSQLAAAPVHMDRKAFTRMKRGKLKPEARIDLHGLRLDRAHPALTHFILTSHAAGRRLVLVITGKGKRGADDGPIPTPRGVLKHHVPQWLALPPLSQAVLQVSQAHVSHGGEGAYYVYLRRTR